MTSESTSATTTPRSDTNDTQNPQPSGSKGNRSIGVHTSGGINADSEEDSHPLRASDMSELRNQAKPFRQNDLHLDKTMVPIEDSEEDSCHRSEENSHSCRRKFDGSLM